MKRLVIFEDDLLWELRAFLLEMLLKIIEMKFRWFYVELKEDFHQIFHFSMFKRIEELL